MRKNFARRFIACSALLSFGCMSAANATLVTTLRTATGTSLSGTVAVSCQSGEVATGGGFQLIGNSFDVYMSANNSFYNGSQGWSVRYGNGSPDGTGTFQVIVQAVCTKQI